MTIIRSYLRVSRESQADSGLGVEAQRNAINTYVEAHYKGSQVVEYSNRIVTGKQERIIVMINLSFII